MELISIVETATVVVTFLMIASGSPVCINMYKQKSTRNVPFTLFLVSELLSILCLQYGLAIKNPSLIFINIVCVLVWGLYASVYILVSKSKTLPVLQLGGVLLVYWLHLVYLKYVAEKDVIATLGAFQMVWGIIAYLTPAIDIPKMVKEKSAASCDLPLLMGGTLSSCVWLLYGILLGDTFIYLPNVLGLLIVGIKFVLIMLYGSGSKQHKA